MGGSIEGCASERPVCYSPYEPVDTENGASSTEDLLSIEERNIELYVQCKQESLGVHYLPTERLRVSPQSIYQIFEDPLEVSELEFACFMANQKLLQFNYKTDSRWGTFYRFFTTRIPDMGFHTEQNEKPVTRDTFDFMVILTGLITLSHSESSVKSILLSEYFTNQSFLKKKKNWALWPRYYYPIRERGDSITTI